MPEQIPNLATKTMIKSKTTIKTHHLALIGITVVATATLLGFFTANFAIVGMSLVSSQVTIAVQPVTCATSDNLISNCSFESAISSLVHSDATSTLSRRSIYYYPYQYAHGGSYVAEVDMDLAGSSLKGGFGTWNVIGSDNTNLQPNTEYELSAYFASSNKKEKFSEMYVAVIINGATVIKGNNVASNASNHPKQWYRSSLTFITPANGGTVALYYGYAEGPDEYQGKYWVDDVKVMSTRDCMARYNDGEVFAYANNGESLFFIPGNWYDPRILCYKAPGSIIGKFYEEYTEHLNGSADSWPYAENKKLCQRFGNYFFNAVDGHWQLGVPGNLSLSQAWNNFVPLSFQGGSIHEISGITFNKKINSFFIVHDGDRKIYEMDTNGNISREILVNGNHDLEGITHINGNRYGLIPEGQRGETLRVYLIQIDAQTEVVDLNLFPNTSIEVGRRGNSDGGLEGIVYHPEKNAIYAFKETDPIVVYRIDMDTLGVTVENNMGDVLNANLTDASGATINPINENIVIVSKNDTLLRTTVLEITTNGNLVYKIDFINNPELTSLELSEGITFDDQGFLYIVGENTNSPQSNASELMKYNVTWCN